MQGKSKKHNKLVISVFIFALICTVVSPFLVSFFYIPKEMKLIAGKEHEFQFHLPLQAQINAQKQGVLKINQKPISEKNIQVSLKEPFSIQSEEMGTWDVRLKLLGIIPLRTVKVDVISNMKVVPCGLTVGVRISTNGIMVLGTGAVNGSDGKIYEPSKGVLQSGDMILEVNGHNMQSKEELIDIVEASKNKSVKMKIKRQESIIETDIHPVKSKEDNMFKIGAWVRDSTQGIGTITYYNPSTMAYGALGHGITDIDTRQLMPIRDGRIMRTEITSIKKGKKGFPGELTGAIIDTEDSVLGDVEINTYQGIYGKINEEKYHQLPQEAIPIALQQEIHEGYATILTNIDGKEIDEFDVYIQKVSQFHQDASKGMIVRITDPRLLEHTNGIVQGMSGSPILQDGKLIGAVTHVFVQDPSKGYGIFIENMIKREKTLENNNK